jgi:hypothetical protein
MKGFFDFWKITIFFFSHFIILSKWFKNRFKIGFRGSSLRFSPFGQNSENSDFSFILLW